MYAGQVIEKRQSVIYDNFGNKVLNLVIGQEKELFGIKTLTRKTVVLFRDLAEKAEQVLNPGDYVFFGIARRNPRVYTTKAGTPVEAVDIVAEDFTKISKKQFDAAWPEMSKAILQESDLVFNSQDRAKLMAQDSPADQTQAYNSDAAEFDF